MSRRRDTERTANRFFSALLGALGHEARTEAERLAMANEDATRPDESEVCVADVEEAGKTRKRSLALRRSEPRS